MKEFTSLTETEYAGMSTCKYTLADGHAYQELPTQLRPIISDLTKIWNWSHEKKVPWYASWFKTQWGRLINSRGFEMYPYFQICPTASNSIDIIGAWLGAHAHTTLLVEPAFDNLPLLMKRRNVKLCSISEQVLWEGSEQDRLVDVLEEYKFKALFIVNPNNPTGRTLSRLAFQRILNYCVSHNKILILDNTFHLFNRQPYDFYQLLIDSQVTFFSIEDTGKVFPTQDMKASILTFSQDVVNEITIIYEEIYLCMSPFVLGVLGKMIELTTAVGLQSIIWQDLDRRRHKFRRMLEETPLCIASASVDSSSSVEWIDCFATGLNDLEIVNILSQYGAMFLPGRYFFWDTSPPTENKSHYIRASLFKPMQTLNGGIEVLKQFGESWQMPNRMSC